MYKQSTLILRVATLAIICSCFVGKVVADEPAAWRAFDLAGKVASIQPEMDPKGVRGYEVLVEENGLVSARLSVNRNGVLSNAWKTDLDADGNPEIVVAVGQLAGSDAGSADIHEWDGYKFSSHRTVQSIPAEKSRYGGHDQYNVSGGQLIREFPRFTNRDGARVPSGEKALYRYDMQAGQWVVR